VTVANGSALFKIVSCQHGYNSVCVTWSKLGETIPCDRQACAHGSYAHDQMHSLACLPGWTKFYSTQPQNVLCSTEACIENQTEMVTLTVAELAAGKFIVNLR
jgi:hypothetical protein